MIRSEAGRVLAIGLDAAEGSLVEQMIGEGELPAMKNLLDGGTWSRVDSPARFGSGTVWPTFFTGEDVSEHGHYAHWGWDPTTMSLQYYDADRHTPFWETLDKDGTTIGVVDVPFAPYIGLSKGFEVLEWGAHDWVNGRPHISPPAVHDTVTNDFTSHPFSHALSVPPKDPSALSAFNADCADGARLRGELVQRLIAEDQPDLALVVFPEVHRSGHYNWHTTDPVLQLYDDLRATPAPDHSLADLHREVDRQVGRLVETVAPETAVLVFALHGMAPARGVPSVLGPLLEGLGLAHIRPWADRRRSAVATVKRRLPKVLRNLYRSSVPLQVRSEWGKSSILPNFDWSRTRAFSLPTDQHGWIRLNLAGREAHGIVRPAEYAATCDLIGSALRALTTEDGRPVVRDVVRPPRGTDRAGLPDLVVHWDTAAFESPVWVNGVETRPDKLEETGQHAPGGFCIAHGDAFTGKIGESIAAKDIHRLITGALGA